MMFGKVNTYLQDESKARPPLENQSLEQDMILAQSFIAESEKLIASCRSFSDLSFASTACPQIKLSSKLECNSSNLSATDGLRLAIIQQTLDGGCNKEQEEETDDISVLSLLKDDDVDCFSYSSFLDWNFHDSLPSDSDEDFTICQDACDPPSNIVVLCNQPYTSIGKRKYEQSIMESSDDCHPVSPEALKRNLDDLLSHSVVASGLPQMASDGQENAYNPARDQQQESKDWNDDLTSRPSKIRRVMECVSEQSIEPTPFFVAKRDEEPLVRCMARLNELMQKSVETQMALQEFDRQNGLPRSHSYTMVNSSRSRKQLQSGLILSKRSGEPLVNIVPTKVNP